MFYICLWKLFKRRSIHQRQIFVGYSRTSQRKGIDRTVVSSRKTSGSHAESPFTWFRFSLRWLFFLLYNRSGLYGLYFFYNLFFSLNNRRCLVVFFYIIFMTVFRYHLFNRYFRRSLDGRYIIYSRIDRQETRTQRTLFRFLFLFSNSFLIFCHSSHPLFIVHLLLGFLLDFLGYFYQFFFLAVPRNTER